MSLTTRLKTAAAVVALALITACSPPMASGVVTAKDHSSAHTQFCGKGCFMWVPESWDLRVEGVNREGEPDAQWVEVGEDVWATYAVGDAYTAVDQ